METALVYSDIEADRGAPSSVLSKAFGLLRAFSHDQRTMTLTEIARQSGLAKSTAYRVLTTLLDLGVVDRAPGGYKVGSGMFPLGTLSFDARFYDVSFPILQRLQLSSGRTVHKAGLVDDQVVYYSKFIGARSPSTPALIGRQLPAQYTALGKALLAFRDPLGTRLPKTAYAKQTTTFGESAPLGEYLRSVAAHGVAIEREEAAPELACIAAPVLMNGRVAAAVSIAIDSNEPLSRALVNDLRVTAVAVGRAMETVR